MHLKSKLLLVIGIGVSSSLASCAQQPTTLDGGGVGITGQCTPPPDVQSVIASCTSCHDGSSQDRLRTPADFQAKSSKGGTMADRSIARMKDSGDPMPPGGVPSKTKVAAFQQWVTDGYPLNCPTTSSAGGAGGGGGAGGATSGGGSGAVAP